MVPIESGLENKAGVYSDIRQAMADEGFVLGGNWDYESGSFDKNLDGANKVWLRVPFEVTQGELDAAAPEVKAEIKLGAPFVLKHLYEEGLDEEARSNTLGGMVNQFQEPRDADAEVESEWIEKAERILKRVGERL